MKAKKIPLRNKAGDIVAYTLVDPTDYTWLSQWRWYRNRTGYVRRVQRIEGKNRPILMHREVLGLERGDGKHVDHINGDRLDNRRENLRVVTKRQNELNRRSAAGSTSDCVGVSWHARRAKWQADVMVDRRNRYLGYYESEVAAARAYNLGKAILAADPNYHFYNNPEGPLDEKDARRLLKLQRDLSSVDIPSP